MEFLGNLHGKEYFDIFSFRWKLVFLDDIACKIVMSTLNKSIIIITCTESIDIVLLPLSTRTIEIEVILVKHCDYDHFKAKCSCINIYCNVFLSHLQQLSGLNPVVIGTVRFFDVSNLLSLVFLWDATIVGTEGKFFLIS